MPIAPILAGLGTLVAGGASLYSAWKNNKNQRENLAYQKDLQQKVFTREDTAVARRRADMLKSRFSGTLAAGAPAQTGPVIKTTPPEVNLQGVSKMAESAQVYMSLLQQKKDIARTEAQTSLIELQKQKLTSMTPLQAEGQTIKNRVANATSEANIRKAVNQATSSGRAVTNQRLESDIRRLNITNQTIQNTRSSIAQSLESYNLSKKEELFVAKQIAIEISIQNLRKQSYNNDWYSRMNLPVGSGLSKEMQIGAVLGGAAGGL